MIATRAKKVAAEGRRMRCYNNRSCGAGLTVPPHPPQAVPLPLKGKAKKCEVFMNQAYNRKLTANARKLRKDMTKEERHLWYDFLKPLPITVHRQKVLGNYIVDFYIPSAKLVIELDGSQHYEGSGKAADATRDAYLRSLGLQVVRYSNADINQRFQAVCEDIRKHL